MNATKLKIPEVLVNWAKAVESLDVDTVVGHYHPQAHLMGTVAGNLAWTPEQIRKYFEHFLNKRSIKVHWTDVVEEEVGDITLFGGTYSFEMENGGPVSTVRARFTFVLSGGKILQHHSSKVPKGAIEL